MNTKTIQAIDDIRSHFKALRQTAEGAPGFPGWSQAGRINSSLYEAESGLVCFVLECEPEEAEEEPVRPPVLAAIDALRAAKTRLDEATAGLPTLAEPLGILHPSMSSSEEDAFLEEVPAPTSARIRLLQEKMEAQIAARNARQSELKHLKAELAEALFKAAESSK